MGERATRVARLLAVLACLVLAVIGLRGLAGLHLAVTPPAVDSDASRWLSLEILLLLAIVSYWARRRIMRNRRRGSDWADRGVPPSVDRWRAMLALLLLLPLLAFAALGFFAATTAPVPQTPTPAPSGRPSGGGAAVWLRGMLPTATLVVGIVAAVVAVAAMVGLYLRRTGPPVQVEAGPDARQRWLAALEAAAEAIRSAGLDEPRAAVIACYAAMERSLAQTSAAPGAADTPTQVLTRARAEGLLHGDAAARLTELFTEARYSRHPFTDRHRQDASAALDAIMTELNDRQSMAGVAR
jgi:uncharacterized protein DUF4129